MAVPSAPPAASRIAGRYEPLHALGRGGMAEVWAVRDTVTGRELALKRLLRGTDTHEGTLFEREYRTLASLKHPRIVEVFDYGVDEGRGFYTMERLHGAELTQSVPLPWPEACSCLRDVASILGVLHARRLIYRDLNPRNLWRTPDGRIKLLDFGAMSPFGRAPEVVGAAPLVAPEALSGEPLDQRTDLYSLGALGYWLITSAHAYRAARLDDLHFAWKRAPARPSTLVNLIPRGDTPEFPLALERLLLRMLKHDPSERPRSTEDVIDALNEIAELEREGHAAGSQGYLQRSAFVGRDRECRTFDTQLAQARDGRPQALLIEGASGTGRSRLLEELATTARIGGAVTVWVECAGLGGAYGVAGAALAGLLRAAPEEATAAATPHAPVLGHLSVELHELLGSGPRDPSLIGAPDERLRRQDALCGAIESLSSSRPLVLLFDDLDAADEESIALLTTLAKLSPGHAVMLAGTSTSRTSGEDPTHLDVFASRSHTTTLEPFTHAEVHELLRSLFGEVRYLDRLAARIFALSGGNASHCMLLARHLVDTQAIRYADGNWNLPMDLPEAGMPRSLLDGWLRKVEEIGPGARRVLRALSVIEQGGITAQQCRDAAYDDPEEVEAAIEELRARGFLTRSRRDLSFVHPALRDALRADVPEEERRAVHERIASVLEASAGDDPDVQLKASLHWLRAGRLDRGETLLLAAGRAHTTDPAEKLRDAAPLYAEAVALLRSAGRDDHALLLPLTALAAAGHYVDRSYAEAHGDDAIAALSRALKLPLARKLKPWLGGKLALILALVVAGIVLRFRRHAPPVEHLVYCFLVASSTLVGTTAICLDVARGRRYVAATEPLTWLGPRHAASLIHKFNAALILSIEDYPATSIRELQRIVDVLRAPEEIEGLDAPTRQRYLGGALYARGIKEAFYIDGSSCRTADELQSFGRSLSLYANHLRALHHAYRGEHERAEDYLRRVEVGAIQLGTAWQAETWGAAMINNSYWGFDAVPLNRSTQELGRLARELPAFRYYEDLARASHLLLHKKGAQAIEVLEAGAIPPLAQLAWAHAQGLLAGGYNLIGEHAKALSICEDVYRRKSPEEQEPIGLMAVVHVEAARACAGLGRHTEAAERLDPILDAYGDSHGALTAGYLHHTRAELALAAGDAETCEAHIERARAAWRSEGLLGGQEATDALAFQLEKFRGNLLEGDLAVPADDGHLATRMQIVLDSGAGTPFERIGSALRVACQGTGASDGLLLFPDERVGHISTESSRTAPPEVLRWAREQLLRSQEDEATEMVELDREGSEISQTESRVLKVEGREYMLIPLWGIKQQLDHVVAALVLGFDGVQPSRPSDSAWAIICKQLVTSCISVSESRGFNEG